jgi:hypothetical protein
VGRVEDPEMHRPIADLGMLGEVDVDRSGRVRVEVLLTTATCPLRESFGAAVAEAVASVLPAAGVDVTFGGLTIALLLRLMDSFMIYTEPFVLTGGGPGTATTFLSQYLTQKAVGQFDLGPAAAFSLVYFLIILLLCFVLYNFMKDPQ